MLSAGKPDRLVAGLFAFLVLSVMHKDLHEVRYKKPNFNLSKILQKDLKLSDQIAIDAYLKCV